MRYQRFKKISIILLIIFGLFGVVIAIFAHSLGLATTNHFGLKRIIALCTGLLTSLIACIWMIWCHFETIPKSSSIKTYLYSFGDWLKSRLFFFWVIKCNHNYRNSRTIKWLDRNPTIWVVTSFLIVTFIFSFYITGGKWVMGPSLGYYDRLATAFLEGSVSLLEKPPEALQALSDPYKGNRSGIKYLWDTSYFKGKYYLYWGPLPALLLAAVKTFHQTQIGNARLVLFFTIFMTFFMGGIFHVLRKNYFPTSPSWTSGFFILVTMLSLPMMWLINHPGIYEAAIISGQVFLVAGLFGALKGLVSTRRSSWFVFTGLMWGASVGSRATNLFPIAWMVIVLFVYILSTFKGTRRKFLSFLSLLLPLVFWGFSLGWYNFVRFGSFLETGFQYQLTNQGAWAPNFNNLYSLSFLIPNIYNYFFRHLIYNVGQFPFVSPPFIDDNLWPQLIIIPKDFLSREPVAGLLPSVPIFFLFVLPVLSVLKRFAFWIKEKPYIITEESDTVKWVWWLIAGAAIVSIIATSTFFFSTLRYIADFYALLMIFLVLSINWGMAFLKDNPFWRSILIVVIVVLGIAGIIIGLFACLNDPFNRFKNVNLVLYSSIEKTFNQWFIH